MRNRGPDILYNRFPTYQSTHGPLYRQITCRYERHFVPFVLVRILAVNLFSVLSFSSPSLVRQLPCAFLLLSFVLFFLSHFSMCMASHCFGDSEDARGGGARSVDHHHDHCDFRLFFDLQYMQNYEDKLDGECFFTMRLTGDMHEICKFALGSARFHWCCLDKATVVVVWTQCQWFNISFHAEEQYVRPLIWGG